VVIPPSETGQLQLLAPGAIGTEFLAHREKSKLRAMTRYVRLSPVPVGGALPPTRGLFRNVKRISPGDRDSLAEGSGFELSVPLV
jgi:hypothetical protein